MITREQHLRPIGAMVVLATMSVILFFYIRRGLPPAGMIALALTAGAMVAFTLYPRRLELGVALLPVIAAAVPFSVGTGTQSPLVAALLLAMILLALWVVEAILRRDFEILETPINVPVCAMMLVWVLALVYGQVVRPPIAWVSPTFLVSQLGGLAIFLISAAVLLLAANVGRDRRWIRLASLGVMAVGTAATVIFIVKLAGVNLTTSFLETSGLFGLWFVVLAYSQALFNNRLDPRVRVALVVITVIWMYKATMLETGWISGWLPALAGLATVTWLRSKRVFFILALIAIIGVADNWDTVYEAVIQSNIDEGSGTRTDITEQALQVFVKHPIIGTGPAGYAVDYVNFYRDSPFSQSTHSNYLDILLQTGIVGMALFAWFVAALFRAGNRACHVWRHGFEAGFARAACGGLIGVLVAMSLGDWFIPFVYNQTIAGFRYTSHSWIFLGFLASLARPTTPPEVG